MPHGFSEGLNRLVHIMYKIIVDVFTLGVHGVQEILYMNPDFCYTVTLCLSELRHRILKRTKLSLQILFKHGFLKSFERVLHAVSEISVNGFIFGTYSCQKCLGVHGNLTDAITL